MHRPILACLCIAALAACARQPAAQPQPSPTRVFVEAMLVDIPNNGVALAMLGTGTFAEIAATPDVTVMASPHVLANDREETRLQLGPDASPDSGQPQAWSWKYNPRVLDGDQIQLEFELSSSASSEPAHTTLTLAQNQTAVLGTKFPAPQGHATVVVIQASVVRDQADLRRIFERKMNERAAIVERRRE